MQEGKNAKARARVSAAAAALYPRFFASAKARPRPTNTYRRHLSTAHLAAERVRVLLHFLFRLLFHCCCVALLPAWMAGRSSRPAAACSVHLLIKVL
jgi:hypothetical protein